MRVVCVQRRKNPELQASWALPTSPQDLKGLNHKQNPNHNSKVQNFFEWWGLVRGIKKIEEKIGKIKSC